MALFDDEKQLRVFGIWHNTSFIIIGGGAPKPPGVVKWQDDTVLKEAAEIMIFIDRDFQKKIEAGEAGIDGADIWIEEEE